MASMSNVPYSICPRRGILLAANLLAVLWTAAQSRFDVPSAGGRPSVPPLSTSCLKTESTSWIHWIEGAESVEVPYWGAGTLRTIDSRLASFKTLAIRSRMTTRRDGSMLFGTFAMFSIRVKRSRITAVSSLPWVLVSSFEALGASSQLSFKPNVQKSFASFFEPTRSDQNKL